MASQELLPAEYAKTASTKTEGERRSRQEGGEMWIKAKRQTRGEDRKAELGREKELVREKQKGT